MTIRKLLFRVFLLLLVGILVIPALYTLGNYMNTRDKFSFYIKKAGESRDEHSVVQAGQELENLKYFYFLSDKWYFRYSGARWLAERYLFKDAKLYEAAYFYQRGEYQRVIDSLADMQDDWRAASIIGDAKFRKLQAQYQEADSKKEVAKKKAIIDAVIEQVNPDYERAVKNGPAFGYPDPNFNNRWNYDLTSNKKNIEEALGGPKPLLLLILGPEPPLGSGGPKPPPGRKFGEEKKDGGPPAPKKKG